MSALNKDWWPRNFAEWRPIPRLLVAMYGVLMWQTAQWFMSLPDPNGAQSAFVSTIMVGGAGPIFGFYVNSGPSE